MNALLVGVLLMIPPVTPNGAVGNGVANDTAALVAADGFATGLGTAVTVPGGSFRVASDEDFGVMQFAPGAALVADDGIALTAAETLSWSRAVTDASVFGASPTASASRNTAAFRAAIASRYAQGGGIVTAIPGSYSINDGIEVPETVWLVGRAVPSWRTSSASALAFVPTADFPAHVDANGVSRQIVIRSAGSTATPAPIYSQGTSAMGLRVENVTVDMKNLGANAVAFAWEGVWFSSLAYCKATGFTLDTQIGFWITIASSSLGGTFWNSLDTCLARGTTGSAHGIGFYIQGGSGSVYPTQHFYRNIRSQYNYRGLVMDYCGAGHVFVGSAWENCADNGVTVTNQQITGLPVFIGCESSTNGAYGYSGALLAHETTAQNNTTAGYDSSVFRLRADVTNGYYSSTKPLRSPVHIQDRTTVASSSGMLTCVDGTTYCVLTENITSIVMPSAVNGKPCRIEFKQGAGPYTIAGWPGTVLLSGGSYTPTATNGKIDALSFEYNNTRAAWIETGRSLNC